MNVRDMNTSKKPLIIAAVISAIAFAIFTAPAHAEFRLGTSFGYAESEFERSAFNMSEPVDEFLVTGEDDSGNVDVFAQLRTSTSNNNFSFGVHLGYGQGIGEYSQSVRRGTFDPDNEFDSNGNIIWLDIFGDIDVEIEQGERLDLLGVVAWNRWAFRPYIMLGAASVELDIAATWSAFPEDAYPEPSGQGMGKDNITLTGYKLVVGVEGGSQNWIWHAAVEYVDYGDEETVLLSDILTDELSRGQRNDDIKNFFDRNRYELTQIGARIGISYRF